MVSKIKVADNKQRSKPHRRVEAILDDMGVSYFSEFPMKPYTVDIYIPEWHIAVEVDGPFHVKDKDAVRDDFLNKTYGVEILRLNAKAWMPKPVIEGALTGFIENHADTVMTRKKLCLTVL